MSEDVAQLRNRVAIEPPLFVFDNGLPSPMGEGRQLLCRSKERTVKSHGAFHPKVLKNQEVKGSAEDVASSPTSKATALLAQLLALKMNRLSDFKADNQPSK